MIYLFQLVRNQSNVLTYGKGMALTQIMKYNTSLHVCLAKSFCGRNTDTV